jgi:membrane protease YdiL (CAAX protease family)
MEERGTSPLVAVITSSFIFSIGHLPGDLVNGNLSGGIIHVWGVFLIGMSLGLIYVLTRNLIYPIIIHGILNFISFSGPLVTILGDNLLILSFNIIILIICIIGVGVLLFGLWQLLRKRTAEWVILLREKTHNQIKHGILGFLIIGIVSVFIPLIIQFTLSNIAAYNILLYFIASVGSYGIIIVLFLWLATRATFESHKIQNIKNKY